MAASTHWLASASAMAVLEHGGNAFDAAVAGGFVLQVVEPHLNGPGGDLPVVLWSAARGEPLVICGQGVSPAAATISMLRDDLGLDLVPGTGLLPACVPGSFDAWMLLLRDFGTLRLGQVLSYAIEYAGGGFPVVPNIAATIDSVSELFADEWTTSAELWMPDGRVPTPGTSMRNEQLATTYARLVSEAERATSDRDDQIEHARDAWLRGWVAEALVDWSSSHEVLDVSGRRHAGLLTRDDLASWSATIEQPTRGTYMGVEVCKTGPWGQGPTMLQTLQLLDGFDLTAMGRDSAEYVHTVVEALKLSLADRDAFYGDSGARPVPLAELLGDRYAESRRELIGEQASHEFRPGTVDGVSGRMPRLGAVSESASDAGSGEPTLGAPAPARGDTCHLDVADRARQPCRVHAEWRLAAILAGDPGPRLLPRHPRADVLARGGPAVVACGRPPPTHDVVPIAGASRRGGSDRIRDARRRPAGPVVAGVPVEPRAVRDEPPGGDRRPDVPHRPCTQLFLAAARGAGARRD